MPSRRLFLTCTGISVLLHLIVLWLAYRFPYPAPPPEESFPIFARKASPAAETKDGREAKAEPTPSPATPRSTPGKSGAPGSAPSTSLRDLTPSLGKMVMTREEPS